MMLRIFCLVCCFFFTASLYAEDAPIALEKAPIHTHDIDSIKRGAKFFATNCMVCHTLVYLRYNKLAHDAGITYEKMPINVQKWPFDIRPPDLSLEASYRGADWIYTYLHSFYQDTTRPTGVNNLLVTNTVMPGIIVPYQGLQTKAKDLDASKKIFDHEEEWYDVLQEQQQGSMTEEQFDATITDVVNFLVYAAEPYKNDQERIGLWVIGFLILLFVLTLLLKKTYWKKIK